ncbi:unnamed protein product [Candidula unifasciata]|uniref:Carrier domain-containing protein n=1 Tax=Candidula unifasciata TaxID=100452 RepID=A0A8S3ZH21_9EUPU|nr:unnamed protein product [Candidula unifasciata]
MRASDKVAIIGLGCKVPGADNLEELWRLLKNGENHVIEIPTTRWHHEAVYDEDFNTPAKTHARKAGLLKDHLAFDNKLFNIKDVEADIMDPQQRYVLECCHRALEDAGITRDQIKGSNTSVFIGAMNTDYRSEFNSTSFVPDNYAVTGVASRACDMVICGGTNSILTPDVFIHLSKARMVSPKGQCFAFSDQVDGYTRGEGCGVVILKRLHDALEHKNKIWATIETGCNQDGGTVTPMSKPSEEQQTKLLQEVWSKSQADPSLLTYIEAHGTGTPVGDVVEVKSLGTFLKRNQVERSRYIGSVKTNIGHLESAAGVAGLIKVLLMMKHSKIVPSLHFQRPNPAIDFSGYQLKVPTVLTDWPDVHKVASVSSFGFGGTNCHAIIESPEQLGSTEHDMNRPAMLISHVQQRVIKHGIKQGSIVCFSAMNMESLKGSMKDFINYPNVQSMNIEDLSLTSTKHRDHFPVRQAFVANTTESLLGQVVDEMTKVKHDSTDARKPKIVFVFSGMGTAWAGMGRDYMSTSKVFRDKIREIDNYLKEYVPWSVENRLSTEKDTNDEIFWPIAICACQIATAHLWMSLGVTPDCVIGYSVGEVAAAQVAGRLSLPDAIKVIYYRTNLLAELAGVGRMILFKGVDIETIEEIVSKWPGMANVSTRISPKACAVSGEIEAVVDVEEEIKKMAKNQNLSITIIDLKLPIAYHSHCVDSCKPELRQALSGVGLCPPGVQTQMISTVTGDMVEGPLTSEYWANNVREPVQFLDAVRKSFEDGDNTVYIEVGSKPMMTAHKDDIFPGKNVEVVVSMRSKGNWKTFLEALAKAYTHGCSMDWNNLPSSGNLVTEVPRYSFNLRRCLHSSETSSMIMAGINFLKRGHPYVCNIESTNTYKVFLSMATFPSVFDHNVAGSLIVPGAVYTEIGFAISKQMQFRDAAHYSVSATFEQPCRFSDKTPVVFNLDISSPQTQSSECLSKSYRIDVLQQETLYATLQLHPLFALEDHPAINIPQLEIRCSQSLGKLDIYNGLVKFGFHYGPMYQLLHSAKRNTDECIAVVIVPDGLFHEIPCTTIHPSILDAMIQTYIIVMEDENKKEVLPISIGKVTPYRTFDKQMFVYTKVKDRYGDIVIFDSKLTTLDGDIIVDMEDLTLKFLSAETSKDEHSTKHISRSHWVMKVPDYPYTQQTDSQILYMSNESVPPEVTSIEYSIDEDYSDTVTQQLDMLSRNHILGSFHLIIFNISFTFDESAEAAMIQSKIVNLCMALKSVFCLPLKIPVHVFTRWALPAEYSSSNRDNINPVMTSVWGMIRSALQEQAANISVFDLHLPRSQCSLDRLTSISNFVYKNEHLQRFSEWLVTDSEMFVHEIIPLSSNIVPVFRHISADMHKHVLQVSTGPFGSADRFCVYDESEKRDNSTDHLLINVIETVLFHPKLFSMSVPYSTMVPHRGHLGNGCVVFVLETTGKQDDTGIDGGQHEIISCYPSPVGSHISVPAEATIPREMFEDYSHGDLTTLSLLMSLSDYIKGSSITILTSSSTRGFSQILQDMLTFKDMSHQTRNIECVSQEQLQNGQRVHHTVVSLVLLDSSLIEILIKHWPQAECLITVAPLVSSHVKSLMSFHLPHVDVIVKDPSEIFQPRKLLELIPKVKEFLSCQRSQVSKCLRGGDRLTHRFPEVPADLNDLLKVQTVKVNRSSVRVDHHFLFKRDAVYIVVGGLTGLGWVTVTLLTSQGAGNIAILSRTAPGVDKNIEIRKLSLSTSATIKWFPCDVCDIDSFSQFLNVTITSEFPNKPLKGIFFGAAFGSDAVLNNVTRKSMERVLTPKVLGAWNAHLLTEGNILDYFVLQSSTTSIIGNFGQTSYGTANAFLDGLASYRRHRNLPGQSINWGALTVGMLANNEKAKKSLTEKGMKLLTEEEIKSMMNPILLLDFAQIIACNFDKEQWRRDQLITVHGSASYEMPVTEELRQALHTAPQLPQQDRIHVYIGLLVVLAAQIIGIDKSLLQPDSALQNLGMDSLLAMSIRNEVFKVTQCRLPFFLILNYIFEVCGS